MKLSNYLISILIDTGVFYGTNEGLKMAGIKQAKINMPDVAIYAVVDALVRKGYLASPELKKGIDDMMGQDSRLGTRSRDAYIAILAALGMIVYDSIQAKRVKVIGPLIKAFSAQLANVVLDESLGLSKYN